MGIGRNIYFVARRFDENSGSYAGFIEKFSKFASKNGYKITIFCTGPNKKTKKERTAYGTIYSFPISKIKIPLIGMNNDYLSLARHVRRFFKKRHIFHDDIIIANGRAAYGLPRKKKYLLRMGQPALTFLKNMEIAKKEVSILSRIARFIHFNVQYFIEASCVKRADAFLMPSVETRNLIVNYYGGKRKPYFVPFSGVDSKYFKKGTGINIEGRNLLFIAAGSEKIRKGIMHLERVLPAIFSKYEDVNLIHVGEKFKWNVPGWCKKRIISVGKISWEQMISYYASADMLVSCALNEGFPNIFLEAMAAGTPIVSSDIQGVREYLTHKKEGYIFKRGDLKDMERGISYMLSRPEIRKKMGAAVSSKAKILFYESYYNHLLKFINESLFDRNKKSVNLLQLARNKKRK